MQSTEKHLLLNKSYIECTTTGGSCTVFVPGRKDRAELPKQRKWTCTLHKCVICCMLLVKQIMKASMAEQRSGTNAEIPVKTARQKRIYPD